jgi:hypothetical protein
MAAVTAIAAGVAVAATVGGGLVSANQAKQDAKGFKNTKKRKEWEIKQLEENRQEIPNPYANVTNLSGLATDLSGMMSNPFANLGVATKAADFQAEEADISLANTLDTLVATGASAGGATALAQAALQSKRGVSASIEQQEADIQKLRAQGEQSLQQAKVSEQQRLQNVQMSEGMRMQAAESEGIMFQYGEQEARDIAKLNRLSGQAAQAENNRIRAKEAQSAAYGSIFTGVGNIAGSVAGGAMSGGGGA